MKQSIGGTYLIYFISIFILIVFAFLCGIINYMKAFKVNSAIANALENYEGFNNSSQTEITNKLTSLGYRKGSNKNCSAKTITNDVSGSKISYEAVSSPILNHEACIYEVPLDNNYFKYGITTYIYIDLPWIDEIRIPIYSETEKIYDFSK